MAFKSLQQASTSSSAPIRLQGASFSSSSTPKHWRYDVFLSFRGEDTRKTFTGHLFAALKQRGIEFFRDADHLNRGEDIASGLLSAIKESKMAIVVFSENYASSRWCLNELVEILERKCEKTMDEMVMPVFYHVDPSDVRNQSGRFGKAFKVLEKRFKEKVEKWKSALTKAGNLSGLVLQNDPNGSESDFIQKIIKEVFPKLNKMPLDVGIQVGMDSRVLDIECLLDSISDEDVGIVGIYGMSGIGKTTIARAVYDRISHEFDGSSFLQDVGDRLKQQNGLVEFQKQLLYEVLREEVEIKNTDEGINVIKQRIHRKKVLIVLDDVDESDQLNVLIGRCDWFCLGSRIIITTRNVRLLIDLEEVKKYKAKELNHHESLELFNRHAFKKERPEKEYVKLSDNVIAYAEGLPLVLEVLGKFLFKRSILEWKSVLDKLQRIPNTTIQGKLKISYDALDLSQRTMFLDFACFFITMDKKDAIRILEAKGHHPEIDLSVLIERSLVKKSGNQLRMHHLLRVMGQEIVSQEDPTVPGNRSRLWNGEEIVDVLTNNTGTHKVQGLVLNSARYPLQRTIWQDTRGWGPFTFGGDGTSRSEWSPPPLCLASWGIAQGGVTEDINPLNSPGLEGVTVWTEAFENMDNLRLLKVNYLQLTSGYVHLLKEVLTSSGKKSLFKKLRWLCWHGFNLTCIPTNFDLRNLVILDMQHSSLIEVWKEIKLLGKLEVLNLSHSHCLTRTPNFSKASSLVRLMLEDCTNLVTVDSIGHLHKLVSLNLKGCTNLYNLPRSMGGLKALEEFDLSGCSKLDKLPDDLGDMESLKKLHADGTSIKQLPQSIERLKNLESLSLTKSQGSPSTLISSIWSMVSPRKSPGTLSLTFIPGLCSLKNLTLGGHKFSIPDDLGSLCSLELLNLSDNNFCSIPSSISCLSRLYYLQLTNCTKLQSIPKLPSSIRVLHAENCTGLERLIFSNSKRLHIINLQNCRKLIGIQGLGGFESLPNIQMETVLQMKALRTPTIMLPGSEIPEWFEYQSTECSMTYKLHPTYGYQYREYSITYKLRPRFGYDFEGFLICVVYAANQESYEPTHDYTWLDIAIDGDPRNVPYRHGIVLDRVGHQDNIVVIFASAFEGYDKDFDWSEGDRDKANVRIQPLDGIQVKKCGIHMVYRERDEWCFLDDEKVEKRWNKWVIGPRDISPLNWLKYVSVDHNINPNPDV